MQQVRIIIRHPILAGLLLLLPFWAIDLAAHESQPAYAYISYDEINGLQSRIVVNLQDFLLKTEAIGLVEHSAAEKQLLDALNRESDDAILQRVRSVLLAGNLPILVTTDRHRQLLLTLDASSIDPGVGVLDRRKLILDFSADLFDEEHSIYVQGSQFMPAIIVNYQRDEYDGERTLDESYYLQAGETSPALNMRNRSVDIAALFAGYLKAGFIHVVPLGLDHVLFVAALTLLVSGWKRLGMRISLFTLAHSIALAFAATELITIPALLVEFFIAVSIIYMAVECLRFNRNLRGQSIMVFLFGLVHGLGFANVLSTGDLSAGLFLTAMVAFTVGIELGQLVVVVSCLAFAYFFKRFPLWGIKRFKVLLSLFLGSAGSWMLVERMAM